MKLPLILAYFWPYSSLIEKTMASFYIFKSEILDFGLACDEVERNFLNSHCPVSIIYFMILVHTLNDYSLHTCFVFISI